jgi:hypothetical protein
MEPETNTATTEGQPAEQPRLPNDVPVFPAGDEEVKAPAVTPEAKQEVKEEKVEPAPTTVTLTEEELQKRIEAAVTSTKGGYDGTVQELKRKLKEHETELKKAKDAAQEAGYTAFIQKVESSGLDPNIAQEIVKHRREILSAREILAAEQTKMAEREAQIASGLETLNRAAQAQKAEELIKQHGLDAKVKAELLKAADPTAMENVALKLALQAKQVAETPERKIDSNVLRPKTGRDMSKASDTEKIAYALEVLGK